ncbi:MAG: AIPR family protein [Chromatiales bacterium]|nr:AIPR family protein [Chromatiales bacterium]
MNLDEFLAELRQEVAVRAASTADFTEAAFVEVVSDHLQDSGAADGFDPCSFRHRGMRIDGYSFNLEEATLEIYVAEYRNLAEVSALTKTEVEQAFKRAETFFEKCLTARFVDSLEVSTPAYGFARQIYDRAEEIQRVRFYLLSDGSLSAAVKEILPRREGGREWSYRVWDLRALTRLETTGEPEEIVVNFDDWFGRPLDCLPATELDGAVHSYLAVMPGDWLASIYEKFGSRLLEQNVRTFLQARGKVNKGMRNTLLHEPEMFFPYNNGIAATAANADVVVRGGIGKLHELRGLQIVNGGQTTASIFNVLKKDGCKHLDKVRVQMKLSVIAPEKVNEIVPNISLYANSQNKVSDADLFANHPFHVRMESISRRIWAPSAEGSQLQTHWYYERSRGQYLNAQAYLSRAKKQEFQLQNPRAQVVTKTDLAKVVNTFRCEPHIVSRGAQKNFIAFAEYVGSRDAWVKREKEINDDWFKTSVAQIIVFRTTEKAVQEATWYAQGYRANTVTYAIALVAHAVTKADGAIDFDRIWREQSVSQPLMEAIIGVAEAVQQRIISASAASGVTNVTEWCKRDGCFRDLLESVKVRLPSSIGSALKSRDRVEEDIRAGRKERVLLTADEATIEVFKKGAVYWRGLLDWSKTGLELTPSDIGCLQVAASMPGRQPSGKQSLRILDVERRALEEGFRAQ